jgi:hypothetical protein
MDGALRFAESTNDGLPIVAKSDASDTGLATAGRGRPCNQTTNKCGQ